MIRHHFGSATHVQATEELTEGFFSTAYRVDLADGRAWVVKVSPPPHVRVLRYERDIMAAEVTVLRLLRQHTSLPVPEVHTYDASRTLLDHEFFLMDYLPGVPLHKVRRDLSHEVQQRLGREIGGYLREINTIQGAAFGYGSDNMPRFATWREAYDAMLQDVLHDGEDMDVELPRPYSQIYNLACQHYAALDEVTTPYLVHWDLWDGNILFDTETQTITGIIDHERALWGDPLMELNFGTGLYKPDSAFAEGYGVPVLVTHAQRTRRRLYDLYLFLIMVIEVHYRQYPDDRQETWARGKLADTLDALRKCGIDQHRASQRKHRDTQR
jgi:aminoglycoside phosphotransferase (APT) family kinase protein